MSPVEMDEVIKTTVRYRDTGGVNRQRPIIHIEAAEGENLRNNLIRASIDSGRDNPFKPDGKIYKSADPIVDYYKFGPNQSRNQSPSDSHLLVGYEDSKGKKSKRKKKEKKSKKDKRQTSNSNDTDSAEKKACWRRWLCCCCCCCCCTSNKTETAPMTGNDSNGQNQTKTKDANKQTKIVVLNTPDTPSTAGETTSMATATTRVIRSYPAQVDSGNATVTTKSTKTSTSNKSTNGNFDRQATKTTTTPVSSDQRPLEAHANWGVNTPKSSKCVIS